jgi:hypothetical protein
VTTAAAGAGSSTPGTPTTPAASPPATTTPVAVSVNPAQSGRAVSPLGPERARGRPGRPSRRLGPVCPAR